MNQEMAALERADERQADSVARLERIMRKGFGMPDED
jgi:hypothetical protein